MQNESEMNTLSLQKKTLLQVQKDFQNSLFNFESPEQAISSLGLKQDRLHVYQRSYLSRVLSSLKEDYPWLKTVLSETKFDFWMKQYISANPSTSYTLAEVSRGVSEFLQKNISDRPWLSELARLEWLYCEASFTRYSENWGETGFNWQKFFTDNPPEKIFQSRFEFCPTIRFFHSRWSFDEFLEHEGAEFSFDWELPEKEYFAVIHRSDVTHSERYEKEEWNFLRQLHEGATVEEALENTSTINADEMQEWFQHWIKERIVVGIFN